MKLREITCISDLYYVIGRWFTLLMVMMSFTTVPFALDRWDSPFSFFVCAGIAFVGVAANYRDKTEYPIHYISACISMACCIIYVAHVLPAALFLLLFGIIALDDKKRQLLWIEWPCFAAFYLTLIIG